jgi:UBX domain
MVVASDPDAVKISFRQGSGPPIVRRFNKGETVQVLFAFVHSTVPESRDRAFDLMTAYPAKSIKPLVESTVGEAGLGGSLLMIKWL